MEVSYNITAPIESLGKAQSGSGWRLTFDWKMPDSTYNQTVNGQDWERIKGFGVGDMVDAILTRGNLKNGKDGTKTYDFFWNLDGLRPTEGGPITSSQPAPQANGTKPTASLDTRIAWNSAINNAVHLSTGHDAEIDYGIIQNRAEKIYAMIIAGPPEAGEDVPWQDPRADRAPDMAPEGSQLAATALATAERLTRPPAVAGEAKMKELDQARYDANGDTYCTPEELVNYICNEHDERGPRFLTVEEVDKVIEDMRAGFVTDIAVF